MGIQVVYVLSASGWDRYAMMTWVSAYSVRRVHRDVTISVLIDDDTWDHHKNSIWRPLEQVVDKCIRVETKLRDKKRSALLMKALTRQHVQGDYIFLDTDILAFRPFAEILQQTPMVGASLDCNLPAGHPKILPPRHKQFIEQMGWGSNLPMFVNTGVIAVKDCETVQKLFLDWERRYRIGLTCDCWDDQPTFNVAVAHSNTPITVVPVAYNAMILIRPYLARHAKLAHFFASHKGVQGTLMNHLLEHLDKTGEFDEAALDKCIREGHPWAPNCEAWQLWQSRNYTKAVVAKTRKFFFGNRSRSTAEVSA